jgi:hypothetical protein
MRLGLGAISEMGVGTRIYGPGFIESWGPSSARFNPSKSMRKKMA